MRSVEIMELLMLSNSPVAFSSVSFDESEALAQAHRRRYSFTPVISAFDLCFQNFVLEVQLGVFSLD